MQIPSCGARARGKETRLAMGGAGGDNAASRLGRYAAEFGLPPREALEYFSDRPSVAIHEALAASVSVPAGLAARRKELPIFSPALPQQQSHTSSRATSGAAEGGLRSRLDPWGRFPDSVHAGGRRAARLLRADADADADAAQAAPTASAQGGAEISDGLTSPVRQRKEIVVETPPRVDRPTRRLRQPLVAKDEETASKTSHKRQCRREPPPPGNGVGIQELLSRRQDKAGSPLLPAQRGAAGRPPSAEACAGGADSGFFFAWVESNIKAPGSHDGRGCGRFRAERVERQ
eukprot:TRINITY_DN5409_c0_g3_i1.p1 TRINITY_DN5409_c0_g3~~TRINITY_DN5409_c0_g3_i1.p1  ORF type:complete len:316 (-),score=55.72 TRINITY_DN5409_c0_g3_i1:276-1145(-)